MNSNSLFLVGKTKERDDTAQQEQSGLWGQVGDCGEAPGGRCPPREPAGAAAWSPGRPTPREPAPQDIRPAWPGAGPPERGAWGAGCRCTQILESGGRGDSECPRLPAGPPRAAPQGRSCSHRPPPRTTSGAPSPPPNPPFPPPPPRLVLAQALSPCRCSAPSPFSFLFSSWQWPPPATLRSGRTCRCGRRAVNGQGGASAEWEH